MISHIPDNDTATSTNENEGGAMESMGAAVPSGTAVEPQTTLASIAVAAAKTANIVAGEGDIMNDDTDPFLDIDNQHYNDVAQDLGPADGEKTKKRSRHWLKVQDKEAIYKDLLQYGLDEKGKLPFGIVTRIARKYNTTAKNVARIWKRGYVEKLPLLDCRQMNRGASKYSEEELKIRLETARRSGGEGAHHLRSLRDIGRFLGVCSSTAHRYLQKWKKEEEIEKKRNEGKHVEQTEPKTGLALDNSNAVVNVPQRRDEDPTVDFVPPVYKKIPKPPTDDNQHRYVFESEDETNDNDNDGNDDDDNNDAMELEEEELPPIRPGPNTKKLIEEKGSSKFCIFCGEKIVIVAKFCSNCGGEQITPALLTRRSRAKKK